MPWKQDASMTTALLDAALDAQRRQSRKVRIVIMRSGNTWGLAFADNNGPAHRISNRKGSGSWETVATLNCEFSLAELATHEISDEA